MQDSSTSALELAIESLIVSMMDQLMEKVLVTDPFNKEDHRRKKPLYAALVPDEIFKGSHFERRFVTPFGKLWERLAIVVAEHRFGTASQEARVSGTIPRVRLERIAETLRNLEHKTHRSKARPKWNRELEYILAGDGSLVDVDVVCDVLATDSSNGQKLAFEIKAPLPNSDQTKVSKEKLLKLYAMEPCQVKDAFFALPYNPYGNRQDYKWSFPMRWFDMHKDPCVLIGNDFWDLLGGEGTYDVFVNVVRRLGEKYQTEIYRKYLELDPPDKSPKIVFQKTDLK